VLVVVLVLENPDGFAIRLTEQISRRTSVSLRPPQSQCTEDEHDDEDVPGSLPQVHLDHEPELRSLARISSLRPISSEK